MAIFLRLDNHRQDKHEGSEQFNISRNFFCTKSHNFNKNVKFIIIERIEKDRNIKPKTEIIK